MKKKIKTNKLSIYLINDEFNLPSKIIKSEESLDRIQIQENAWMYSKSSKIKAPGWINKFFLLEPEEINIKSASSQALYLTKIDIDEENTRFFAIPFGVGYHLLNDGVIEERFGLKIVLNTVDEKLLKSIDKTNMSNVPKQAREQISLSSEVNDFGIDIEQDLILGVTGKSKNEDYGKTITGKDSLKVSVKQDVSTISDFLKKCYSQYLKKDYETNFGWIDQISEVKNRALIESLNNQVLDNIKKQDFTKTWMSIPEIIDWNDVSGFKYSSNLSAELNDDIYLYSFLDTIYEDKDYSSVEVSKLKENKVICYSESTGFEYRKWLVYNCLYSEVSIENQSYILNNGKWYEINSDFVKIVEDDYKQIISKKIDLDLPDYSHQNEGDYNTDTCKVDDFMLMDKKNISYGGGYSKIEFCDIYTQNKELIHVKKYGGSSVLSHLFNQGLVSGELFYTERAFRDKVDALLSDRFKIQDIDSIEASKYKIVFGVISFSKKDLNIPFFSKVSLRNVKRRLESLKYEVYIKKINGNIE